MERKVLINLRSINTVNGESSETELLTDGVLRILDNGAVEISYEESEVTGFEGSTTFLTVTSDRLVNLKRVGTAPSNLTIEVDKKHHCHYGTPYGDFMMGVYTHAVKSTLTFDGGDLYLKYAIDVNSSHVSDNEIFLNVK